MRLSALPGDNPAGHPNFACNFREPVDRRMSQVLNLTRDNAVCGGQLSYFRSYSREVLTAATRQSFVNKDVQLSLLFCKQNQFMLTADDLVKSRDSIQSIYTRVRHALSWQPTTDAPPWL